MILFREIGYLFMYKVVAILKYFIDLYANDIPLLNHLILLCIYRRIVFYFIINYNYIPIEYR